MMQHTILHHNERCTLMQKPQISIIIQDRDLTVLHQKNIMQGSSNLKVKISEIIAVSH